MFSSVVILWCGFFGVKFGSYSKSLLCRDVGVPLGFVFVFSLMGRKKLQLLENVVFGVKPVFELGLCHLPAFSCGINYLTSVKLLG